MTVNPWAASAGRSFWANARVTLFSSTPSGRCAPVSGSSVRRIEYDEIAIEAQGGTFGTDGATG